MTALVTATPAAAAPQTLSAGGSLFFPQAAVDARGDAVIAWITNDGAVRASVRHGTTRFGAPRAIGRAGNENLPLRKVSVAMTADGDAVALWAQQAAKAPRYRLVAAIAPRGRRFGRPFLVGASTTALRADPRLLVGPRDDVIAGWHRDDVGLQIAVRRAGRSRFGAPSAPMILPYSDVSWTVARDGRLHLAWAMRGPDGSYVATTSGRLGGRWSTIAPVSKSGRSGPLIAAAPNGALVAAFRVAEQREGLLTGAVEALTGQVGRGFSGPLASQTLTPNGVQADDALLAVGPHAQAAVTWSDTIYRPNRGVSAWIATRPAGGKFSGAQPLAADGVQALTPVAAFDASGRLTVAGVSGDRQRSRLDIWRGANLANPQITAQSTASNATALAWSSATVAAAGTHTVVGWSSGPRGPVRIYSFG